MAPLTRLLRKDVRFVWDEECQTAFDELKASLTTTPVLKTPDFGQPFLLTTNASGKALSGVLSKESRPVAYESRKLKYA